MGLLPGVPGSADAAGPQVPIAAQTAVGLVPGVPGSVDAIDPQVPIAAQTAVRLLPGLRQTTVGLVPGVPSSRCQVEVRAASSLPTSSSREWIVPAGVPGTSPAEAGLSLPMNKGTLGPLSYAATGAVTRVRGSGNPSS